MTPLNDDELNNLLRQWPAPNAPAHIESAIFGAEPKPRRWNWFLTGAIRVPVPVALLLLILAGAAAYTLPRMRTPIPEAAREIRLSDFQPVSEIELKLVRR